MPPTVISCSGEFKSFKPFNRFAQFKSFNEAKHGRSISGEFTLKTKI